jgi:hypothetical protein
MPSTRLNSISYAVKKGNMTCCKSLLWQILKFCRIQSSLKWITHTLTCHSRSKLKLNLSFCSDNFVFKLFNCDIAAYSIITCYSLTTAIILNFMTVSSCSNNHDQLCYCHMKSKSKAMSTVTYRSTITPLALVDHFWSHVL